MIPEKLGRYRILKKLATGGMGEIFLAKLVGAEGFEKSVAVKKILPQWSSNPEFASMLVDEAKIVVELTHPNIVQVYELGREREDLFLAMEFVDGIDLKCLTSLQIPEEVCLFIIVEILSGLGYAHQKDSTNGRPLRVIHRDISPQNILISFDGRVKITDFGIAKAASRTAHSASGELKGKFAYMSPEQAMGGELDSRSDLFSVGILLHELLSSRRLFEGKGDIEILEKVRRADFSFPEGRIITTELEQILRKSLQKDRSARFQSAGEFREEILAYAKQRNLHLREEKLVSFLKEKRPEIELTRSIDPFLADTKPIVSHRPRPSRTLLVAGLVGVVLVAIFLWVLSHWTRTGKPVTHPSMPVVSVPVKSDKPTPIATPKGQAPRPGSGQATLSVQALPWGSVAIDQGKNIETPVHAYPLEPGPHEIQVYYRPTNKYLKASFEAGKEGRIRCQADFRPGKTGIRCR